MYAVSVVLLLLVLPFVSIVIEVLWGGHGGSTLFIVGRWFVFWAAGVRLFIAGVRQVVQPSFTAQEILGIEGGGAFVLVRELGFANLSMGLLSMCSVFHAAWVLPGAMVGGLYYGLAGAGHIPQPHRNAKENLAVISDGLMFLVLAGFFVLSLR
jgi:hypothetical protein